MCRCWQGPPPVSIRDAGLFARSRVVGAIRPASDSVSSPTATSRPGGRAVRRTTPTTRAMPIRSLRVLTAATAVMLAFALVGLSDVAAAKEATVSVGTVKGVGKALVDAKNHTLYTFVNNGEAMDCTGACLNMGFEPLTVKKGTKPTAGKGVKGLGVVAGGNQVTENGFPLFVFTTDKPHQANGQGLTSGAGTWHVPTVKAPKSSDDGGSNAGTGGVSF